MADLETITSCMKHIPMSLRPDRSVCDLSFCAGKDAIIVLSVGTQFIYIIPSFASVGILMRQVRVKTYTESGQEELYDLFMRSDNSLYRHYPAWCAVKDILAVKVLLTNTLGEAFII